MHFSLLITLATLAQVATVSAAPLKRALPRLGGYNIAGFDFGTGIDGSFSGSYVNPGTSQFTHFAAGGANLFRIPFGWNPMVGGNLGGTLSSTFFSQFDTVVQAALSTGAYVILDCHNYARWNGAIVGQGGPSNAQLASLWSQIATKYASNPKIMFGLMNEPHDIPSISAWATTVQASVNAIRAAGATSNPILIPGNEWSHVPNWISGSNNPLLAVTDPSGGTGLLILDIHQYLDSDGSGTHADCVTDNVNRMTSMSSWLSANGRQAILSETGGGSTSSCITALGAQFRYVASVPSTVVGFAVWSGGAFDSSYVLSISPVNGQDIPLVVQAIKPYLPGAGSITPVVSTTASSSSTVRSTTVSSSTVTSSTSVSSPATSAPTTSKPSSTSSTTSSSKTTTSSTSTTSPKPSTTSTTAKPTTAPSTTISKTSTAPSTTTSTPPTSGNLQTYTGALAGIGAPPVTASGNQWMTNNVLFNFAHDALVRSCYVQMDKCQLWANQHGNFNPSVDDCNNKQVNACMASITV